jgi:hypothetical protein
MVVDLIHELIDSKDPLTVKMKRIVRFQPVTKEIMGSTISLVTAP